MKRIVLVLLLLSTPALHGCAGNKPPTAVASVADIGAKIEMTVHEIFTAAQTYNHNQVTNPVTHKLLVDTPTVDQIALVTFKIGHAGIDLDNALEAYNAAKAAGKDPAAQRAVVLQILDTVFAAMGDVQKALPPGVVGQIDQLVVSVLTIVQQARNGVGL